jgi:predicted porin
MNKKLLAVAVVGALASPVAFAQTLYGIVDLGYQNAKHSDADVNKDFMVQGQHSGSRLGVRGSEDLAGGIYAMYQIEFNIQADTGAAAATGTQRLTFVGLGSKAWGELTFGRQYTHHFHTIAVGSATAYATFASIAGQVPELTRASNSFKYSSPVMGGFSVGFLYSPSGSLDAEPTAPGVENEYWDAAIRYTPGPFGVAVSTGAETAEAGGVEGESTMHQISANWDNRAYGIYANWHSVEVELPGFPDFESSGWGLSGIARFGGRHELALMYYRNEDDEFLGFPEEKATTWAFVYQHIMSKRTRIYTGIAKTKNDSGMNFAPTAFAAPVAPGYDPRGFQLGIVHTF